jgi:uncharacterized membrane protein
MSRSVLEKIPLRADPIAKWRPLARGAVVFLFAVQFIIFGVRLFQPQALGVDARWPDGLFLVFATAAILVSAAERLPAQNIMLAASIVAVIGGGVATIGARTAIPFGPYIYTDEIGPRLFPPLPWAIPVLWVLIVFTSRGVGRMMLRPWRKTRNYGFWLMGVTTALVVLFDLGLEPFATHVKHYWLWQPTRAVVYWHGTPWVNFFGWAATTLVMLGFATPSLINKKRVKSPADYFPLVMWVLLNLLLAVGAALHQLWLAVAVITVGSVVVAVFAIKGVRW